MAIILCSLYANLDDKTNFEDVQGVLGQAQGWGTLTNNHISCQPHTRMTTASNYSNTKKHEKQDGDNPPKSVQVTKLFITMHTAVLYEVFAR